MTLPIGSTVEILANATHPHLAGRRGVVVHVTPVLKQCGSQGKRSRLIRCGNNPVVQIGSEKFLLPAGAGSVVGEQGMVA